MCDLPVFSSIEQACQSVQIRFKEPHGEFTVTDAIGGRTRNGAGRIRLFADGKGGMVFNWRTNAKAVFFYDVACSKKSFEHREVTAKRRLDAQRKRTLRMHDAAASLAQCLYRVSHEATPTHPYLCRKHVGFVCPYVRLIEKTRAQSLIDQARVSCREEDAQSLFSCDGEELLLLPLVDWSRRIVSLQLIDQQGRKVFLKGGALKGALWLSMLGMTGSDFTGEIALCEGLATAASVSHVQGIPAVSGLNAGNLGAALRTLSYLYPKASYSIFADRDKSGVGLRSAQEAACHVARTAVYVPTFTTQDIERYRKLTQSDTMPTDFNDLYLVRGAI